MTTNRSWPRVDADAATRASADGELDVGIVYTGDDEAMPALLSSVCRSLGGVRTRVALIDNASHGDATKWRQFADDTTVIRNVQRRRPAEVINQLMQSGTAPLLALIDGDAYFDPDDECIARMVEFMRAHTDCALAGCRWFDERGQERHPERPFPTITSTLRRRKCQPPASACDTESSSTKRIDCRWPASPLILLRCNALEADVGFLDERLGKDLALADLCLRARLAGWRVLVNPEVACHRLRLHNPPDSQDETSWQRIGSSLRFLRKWGRNPQRRFAEPNANCARATNSQVVLRLLGGSAYPEALDEGIYG